MKFDALHWVQVTLMMIAAGAGAAAEAAPQWSHLCVPIAAAATGMLGAFGLVSHSVMGTTVPNPPAAPPKPLKVGDAVPAAVVVTP